MPPAPAHFGLQPKPLDTICGKVNRVQDADFKQLLGVCRRFISEHSRLHMANENAETRAQLDILTTIEFVAEEVIESLFLA